MIRILHVITDLDTGGAEMMLYKLLKGMDRSRYESIVVSLMDKGTLGLHIEALDIPVYSVNMVDRRPTIKTIWFLLKLICQTRPDVIQGWLYHGSIAATFGKFLCLKKIPLLWNIRNSLYDIRYEKKRTRYIIRICASLSQLAVKIIYNSKNSAAQHIKFGFVKKRTLVIPNGFDSKRFMPSEIARSNLRKQLAIRDNDIVIGLVARYHPVKDHANFLEAASLLIKSYNDVSFVLVGWGVDNSNLELTKLIENKNLSKFVHLLGECDDVENITAGFDIASTSSYTEAFPNVIGEAMAAGVPCVVTDVGDSGWIVGDTGIVVPPRDPVALSNSWLQLINAGRKTRLKKGGAARQRILENFSISEIVQKYETLYAQVYTEYKSKC